MRGLFWVLTLFALAVAVALGAQLNDGYVLLVLPPWRAEITLNLFVVGLLALFVVLYAAMRALALTFGLPARVARYREQRRQKKSVLVFQEAVRLLFEGRFGQALKRAADAYEAGAAPGLSSLIAARAAQRMREPAKQQEWLERAQRDDPRTEAATLMLEAEMMNEERRFDEALAALDKLQRKQGRHIAALKVELRARQGAGDWVGVLKLSRQLAKRDALPAEVVGEIRTQAHLANIAQRAADPDELKHYLRALTEDDRCRRVVLAAARALTAQGAEAEAQKLIETQLDRGREDLWQSDLVAIYGRLTNGEPTVRIAKAESWVKRHADDPVLLIALGRMCFRQRLWGKARSYLEASLSVRETQEAHLELARLCDQLGLTDEANQHYRASVRLDGQAAPAVSG